MDDREIELDNIAVELANRLGWAGEEIFFVCERALTDANFHTLAKNLRKEFEKTMAKTN